MFKSEVSLELKRESFFQDKFPMDCETHPPSYLMNNKINGLLMPYDLQYNLIQPYLIQHTDYLPSMTDHVTLLQAHFIIL